MNSVSPIIKRSIYLDKLTPFIGKGVIKVITGQRRVGKSYLLLQLKEAIASIDAEASFIYINKEQYDFDAIVSYHQLVEYVERHQSPTSTTYLMVDEIQDIDHFEKALRHLLLNDKLDIYCTGSNANLMSGELATLLGGRYIECRVYSLSYTEFLQFQQTTASHESLQHYLLWGGLPFIKHLEKKDDVVMDYLQNISSAILFKDVIQRNNIRNTGFLENLVDYLASNTGSIISAKRISDYLKSQQIKISPQVVLNLLDYLQQGMLIFKVKRKDLTGRKVFEIHEKYYFEDWGMMNARIGFSNWDIGKVLENVVFIHLKLHGYDVFVGSLPKGEIDFSAEKNGKRVYIQVCYLIAGDEVIKREFGNLQAIADNYPKMVVSLDSFAPANIEGIIHMHLLDFLQTFPSGEG